MIIPIFILYICSYLSNQPTPENEHLTNFEVAKILELDNYTIENNVVGLRARTNDLSIFTANYASALTILNYIIIIFCGISIQIRVYRHCKGVEMTQLRNMNKQLSIVLGTQVSNRVVGLIAVPNRLNRNLNFSKLCIQKFGDRKGLTIHFSYATIVETKNRCTSTRKFLNFYSRSHRNR
ncbi:unnamed protein product [Meloidogyne enterolobii]|uniref:Uncharacterized protein n=2 Tax=Meloidogyne enterolobii TaxID=390850 RepID=A0ACB1A9B0_MELEN